MGKNGRFQESARVSRIARRSLPFSATSNIPSTTSRVIIRKRVSKIVSSLESYLGLILPYAKV
mgnify:CR=1 FL=1